MYLPTMFSSLHETIWPTNVNLHMEWLAIIRPITLHGLTCYYQDHYNLLIKNPYFKSEKGSNYHGLIVTWDHVTSKRELTQGMTCCLEDYHTIHTLLIKNSYFKSEKGSNYHGLIVTWDHLTSKRELTHGMTCFLEDHHTKHTLLIKKPYIKSEK